MKTITNKQIQKHRELIRTEMRKAEVKVISSLYKVTELSEKRLEQLVKRRAGSSMADKLWRMLPKISACRPHPIGGENSLQRYDKTNVVRWYRSEKGGIWNPVSPAFLIESK